MSTNSPLLENAAAADESLTAAPQKSGRENRQSDRYRFSVVRQIAPRAAMKLPKRGDFFPVRCCDVSSTGISFLLRQRPQVSAFVVALEINGKPRQLIADVKHCSDVLVDPMGNINAAATEAIQDGECEPGAAAMVLVGAHFAQRVPE
jgi:hypothetical protein